MTRTDLESARARFAERLREAAGLRSERLVAAFAAVPREEFLGPGPWRILVPPDYATYRDTPDDDPRHLCENVLVALDESRRLNNGEPAALAGWFDALAPAPGERVLHLGSGVGYYTAILARTVGDEGCVVAVEVDPELASRARRNLAPYSNVTVFPGDGSALDELPFRAIFVNAGATDVRPEWIERLEAGGRLLFPLTTDIPGFGAGFGHMLLVERRAAGFAARFVSPVAVFHCVGARTEQGGASLQRAFERGGEGGVRSLRTDRHDPDAECWLHGSAFCLSCASV